MYGGAFNPPLNSHFSLAQQIINNYEQVNKVVFVPVNSQYQKSNLISNEHRYQMLQLVCNQNEKFEVSRIELDSSRPLYTIETLKRLQEQYIENEIAFMIGSDNLKELDTWKNAEELVTKFKVYVVERGENTIKTIIQKNEFLKRHKEAFLITKNEIVTNLSSTYVRQKIKEGKSIQYLTQKEVIEYISKNKLYQ